MGEKMTHRIIVHFNGGDKVVIGTNDVDDTLAQIQKQTSGWLELDGKIIYLNNVTYVETDEQRDRSVLGFT
ncbi:hypothetical protein ACFOLF_16180 [Paenibacillus sepulcri]|uniref:DUF3954 domain-containing protein n=1 Tax=Paenibacillus sepulcri TaxID=359917 RepID=A0ABS7C3S4_9BACL|nr:hypothetical protein [Paenibacillus sepulcri]